MGEIINSKVLPNNKVVYKILLDKEEIEHMKGHLKNVNLFTANLCNVDSQINQRGNKGVTKYFKIPLSIRSRKKYYGSLFYQKIETTSKVFYIYVIDKEGS